MKSSITASVMPALVQTDSAVVADAFMAKLAERLQIDENAVRSEYNAYVRRHPEAGRQPVVISTNVVKQTESARRGSTTAVAEENILRSLLEHPESYGRIEDKMEASYFVDDVRRSIFEEIHRQYTQTGGYSVSFVKACLLRGRRKRQGFLCPMKCPWMNRYYWTMYYVLSYRLYKMIIKSTAHGRLNTAFAMICG